ncbi:2-keto-4-pentenoate hydratase [Brevibacillus sp. TJ4]|uniref:2-keto-4-pentenoate hydratase n=1 Tax=Brevibacillus sp. TJ4 TaxID=3234853 RepID=UPI0037CDC464
MEAKELTSLARFLESAERNRQEVPRITLQHPSLTVDEAYDIQAEIVKLKVENGSRVIGPKMGLTSAAKMKQMGVEEPIFGYVFDYMVVPNGGTIRFDELIHPKAEAEIAFVLDKDLEGPDVTIEQVLEATRYVLPALEIIDSRYENFKFTLPDVIADNTSASRVVFGDRLIKPSELELDLIGATMLFNGESKAFGASAAVLGHPARSIAMLAAMLSRKGGGLRAGEVILSGAITEAVMFAQGDYVVGKFDVLGDVSFLCK